MNGEHWRDYFDSAYLGAWDLPEDRDAIVTIVRVEKGTLVGLKGKTDKKAIVFFRGKEKPLAANKTNAKTIASMYGHNPREWVGKAIAMYVAKNVDTPNGPVDAIRIRPRIPVQSRAAHKADAWRAANPANPEPQPDQHVTTPGVNDDWTPEEPPHGALESDNEQSS